MSRDRLAAASLSLAWGLVVTVAAYALERAAQALLFPAPDPAMFVWSAHAAYFWRVWTCAYAGAMAAFVAQVPARRRFDRTAQALGPAAAGAAILLALQAVLFP